MTYDAYVKKVEELYSFFQQPLPAAMMEQLQTQFAFVSASLTNFLPDVSTATHHSIYRKILQHQKISLLDESTPWAMRNLVHENDGEEPISFYRTTPAIFCTIHYGSYRLINFFLKQQYIPFALVASSHIIQTERSRFEKHYAQFPVNDAHPLILIDAEHPSAAITMFRTLKSGKSLLIYADGNTGSGVSEANPNINDVSFLSQRLFVRSGVAYLAAKAKCQLVPVICYRQTMLKNVLRFFAPLCCQDINDNAVMQKLYNIYASAIDANPGQWEAWLYLHKVANIINESTTCKGLSYLEADKVSFNSREFAIFKISNNAFLLRKNTYQSFPIDARLHDFLSITLPAGINNTNIEPALLEKLLNERIICMGL